MTSSHFHSQPKYYRESGRVGLIRFPIAIALSIGLLSIAASAYAYCDLYGIHLSFFKIIFPCLYGLVCGLIIGSFIRFGHIRNRAVRGLLLLGLIAATLYGTWCFWEFDVVRREVDHPLTITPLSLMLQPVRTWRLAQVINAVGAWSIGAEHRAEQTYVTGPVLWIIWSIEAIIIVSCCYVVAKAICSGTPYCERCRRWTRHGVRLVTLPPGDIQTLRSQLETGDFVPMISASPAKTTDSIWLEAWTHSCNRCKDFNTLTVKRASDFQAVRRGTLRNKVLIDRLLLSTIDLHALDVIRAEHRKNRAAARDGAQALQADEDPPTENLSESGSDL